MAYFELVLHDASEGFDRVELGETTQEKAEKAALNALQRDSAYTKVVVDKVDFYTGFNGSVRTFYQKGV